MERIIFAALVCLLASFGPARAEDKKPIRIGFGDSQTGSLAPIAKSGILATQIWADKINAAGGLLGRPVELVIYDVQSSPRNVAEVYTKLLDTDQVDIVMSGYATNIAVPGIPVAAAHNKLYLTVFTLAGNSKFHDPRVFTIMPTGPDPKPASSKGFFDIAMSLNPKPETVAFIGSDSVFAANQADGVRQNAAAAGIKVVYDQPYPASTRDLAPIVKAIQALKPDLIFAATYPTESAALLRAAQETGLKARLFGGTLVGLGAAGMKTQIGPLLNNVVLGQYWAPAPKLQYPGVMEFLKEYRERAKSAGTDPLGLYLPPFSYARMQVLEEAIKATNSLDDNKLADYIRDHTFKTVVGDIRFGKDGEWSEARMVWSQYQGVEGNSVGQFMNGERDIVLLPEFAKTGTLVTPYQAPAAE
jgi:branched-chain amino acid transport system substrate-binding protein